MVEVGRGLYITTIIKYRRPWAGLATAGLAARDRPVPASTAGRRCACGPGSAQLREPQQKRGPV